MNFQKNVVKFPYAVANAVKIAHELVLTSSWDHVFPQGGHEFHTANLLGVPPEITSNITWNKTDPKRPKKLGDYEFLKVEIEMQNACLITVEYRRPDPRVDWEIVKITLYIPETGNPQELESVEFPKKIFKPRRKASFDVMKQITMGVIDVLRPLNKRKNRAAQLELFSHFIDYRGFSKLSLPESLIGEILAKHQLTTQDVQVELVSVERDLTTEVHHHKETDAYVRVVGYYDGTGLSAPRNAKAYRNDRWEDVRWGDEFAIPAGVKHGFTVGQPGSLYFLSVQSPPIVKEDGNDDYVK